ncbi:hypothetical protein [Paenibacillus koleovorans]|uniref:hypothetical protein n=1 Tax=Paenibacillus koleovorans TaxID=121608 RepID=UPI000FD950DE|nr:hypothetical protein [Paenibacillus koleovorans]
MTNFIEINNLILENRNTWKELLLFNIVSGEKKVLARTEESKKIQGHYEYYDGNLIMLFRIDNNIYLDINGERVCLNDDGSKINFSRMDRDNYFSVEKDNKKIFEITYPSWEYDALNMVDPSFNEQMEECQDIFLFIHNVAQDRTRLQRLYI